MSIWERTRALLGISTYQQFNPAAGVALTSPELEAIRRAYNGQLSPLPTSQTRWYLSDLEAAEHEADNGYLAQAARLMRASNKDGVLAGVMSTRTGGLVRLPKKFLGDSEIVQALEAGHADAEGHVRSVFDEMFPPQELALLAKDGVQMGVGVGELLPVDGRDYPVFCRLDPQYLTYRWQENTWYFNSFAGPIPITPGDGRWVLHTPGGRIAPWQNALWKCLGKAFIRKDHAQMHCDNWEAKLANPARVAVAPGGATEGQKQDWFRRVMAWGVNTVFGMTPGYDVKLIESNGRGWESFKQTIADQNQEYIIAVCGQTVTTDGGTGFANADIHKSIRSDLIQETADTLAYTLNTQGIPAFVACRWGEDALVRSPIVQWDVTPPKDRSHEAQSLATTATAITALREALVEFDRELDIDAMCARFAIPIKGDSNGDGRPDEKRPTLSLVRSA